MDPVETHGGNMLILQGCGPWYQGYITFYINGILRMRCRETAKWTR